jgi:hypothetical protein
MEAVHSSKMLVTTFKTKLCEIWGFHSHEEEEDNDVLGFGSM